MNSTISFQQLFTVFKNKDATDKIMTYAMPSLITIFTTLFVESIKCVINTIFSMIERMIKLIFEIINKKLFKQKKFITLEYNGSNILNETPYFFWYIDKIITEKKIIIKMSKSLLFFERRNSILDEFKHIQIPITKETKYRKSGDNLYESTTILSDPLEINNKLYIDINLTHPSTENVAGQKGNYDTEYDKSYCTGIHITLFSYKYDTNYLYNYINMTKNECEKYIKLINYQKIYIYTGKLNENNDTKQKTTPKYDILEIDKSQTFDHLFFNNKKTFIEELDNFNKIEFYKKYGLKRKISLLLEGMPGAGKTCICSAIANYLKRNIIYVPISRVKTNQELEKIMNCRNYEGKTLVNDDIIILFDEINYLQQINEHTIASINTQTNNTNNTNGNQTNNTNNSNQTNNTNNSNNSNQTNNINNTNNSNQTNNTNSSNQTNNTNSSNQTNGTNNNQTNQTNMLLNSLQLGMTQMLKPEDNVNMDMFLSLLDGVINQDGLIIIATANETKNLPPAMYREGRLKKVIMDYPNAEQIISMIEFYSNEKLTQEQIKNVRNDMKIQPLTIKKKCIMDIIANKKIDTIIDNINNLT